MDSAPITPSRFERMCESCGHSSNDHHFYDSDSPADPKAQARCVWRRKTEGIDGEFEDPGNPGMQRDCVCADFAGV